MLKKGLELRGFKESVADPCVFIKRGDNVITNSSIGDHKTADSSIGSHEIADSSLGGQRVTSIVGQRTNDSIGTHGNPGLGISATVEQNAKARQTGPNFGAKLTTVLKHRSLPHTAKVSLAYPEGLAPIQLDQEKRIAPPQYRVS